MIITEDLTHNSSTQPTSSREKLTSTFIFIRCFFPNEVFLTYHLISLWTANPQRARRTSTTGIAAIVTPNSAEFRLRTRIKSWEPFNNRQTTKWSIIPAWLLRRSRRSRTLADRSWSGTIDTLLRTQGSMVYQNRDRVAYFSSWD